MPVLKNHRHELFAQQLALGKSYTEAHALAGYNGNRKVASRLATNTDIQARKTELLEAAADRTGVTVDWIVERLRSNAERAMQYEKPEEGGDFRYDGAVANKALELLGKHKGMFKENVNLAANEATLADLVIASYEKGKAASEPKPADKPKDKG